MTNFGQKYGPWALVTGASSGLGSAFAKKLAAKGINVVLVARREDRLRALAAELEQSASIETRVVPADLARDDFLQSIVDATDGLEIGLVVNNAGQTLTSDFLTSELDSELRMLHLNTRAPLMLTHHFGKLMRQRGRGGIIFVASVVGLAGVRTWSNYAATKGHNLLFAEGLGEELKDDGVDVLVVSPAFIQTDFMEMSAFGKALAARPDAVAKSLASLGRKRVVTPGLVHKLIAFSTRFQPRFLNRKIFGAVVARAHGPQASTVAASDGDTRGSRTQENTDWTFDGTWPYEPKWFHTRDGRMHYVDEGPRDGPPVVLVHGNPTWGYLYRNFIPPLVKAGYRVIVPDHLGFGRSDKPDVPELYRIPRHAERLEALLESLDLHDATVVPQDWGGPIGLAWAGLHSERVGRLFILNTFAHKLTSNYKPPLALTLFRTRVIGEFLVKGLNIFVRGFLFRQGVVKRDRLTRIVRQAYLAPHRTWSSRTAVLVFPREIPLTPDAHLSPYLAGVEDRMHLLKDRPVFVAWAMKDPVFTSNFIDEFWRRTFPHAEIMRLTDAGHYLQEDAHEEIVPALLRFLESTKASSPP